MKKYRIYGKNKHFSLKKFLHVLLCCCWTQWVDHARVRTHGIAYEFTLCWPCTWTYIMQFALYPYWDEHWTTLLIIVHFYISYILDVQGGSNKCDTFWESNFIQIRQYLKYLQTMISFEYESGIKIGAQKCKPFSDSQNNHY